MDLCAQVAAAKAARKHYQGVYRRFAWSRPDRNFPQSLAWMSTQTLHAFQDRLVGHYGMNPSFVMGYGDFRPTNEDWFMSFPDNMVGVIFGRCFQIKGWGLTVSGHDDIGMDIIIPTHDRALEMLGSLPNVITRKALLDLGFQDW